MTRRKGTMTRSGLKREYPITSRSPPKRSAA
jgi:hypothetical protein